MSISVEGYFIERFINICMSKKIFLWNMKRKKASFLYANIGLKDFKQIKEIARKTKCHVTIEKKKGLPFLMHRYQKRKLFLGLLLFVVLFILGISNFIWNIEIVGNQEIATNEILEELNENGLKTGMLKQKVKTKDIINQIRLQRHDIAWIGIKLEGTNARVEIVEADKKPEIIDEAQYCNIVSEKEGVIHKINVQNGTALVKPGDIIKKGDLLVGGYLEGKYTGTRYVHAKADIQAKVWYSKKETMAFTNVVKEATGKKENAYGIQINNFKINLPKRVPNFEKYDTINENKKLKIFSNFYFPIEFCITTYEEYTEKEITYEKDEAIEILKKKIEDELKMQIQNPENIVNTRVNTKENDGEIEVEVIYEVLENIGTNEKILF